MLTTRSVTRSAALLVAAALIAVGCGSDDSDDSSAKAKDPKETTADTNEESPDPEERPDPDLAIDPGAGIAGVRIGDSAADVERVLGEADTTTPANNEATGQVQERLVFGDQQVELIIGDDRVVQVETTNPDSRTDGGVGVGSSQADFDEAFPDAVCDADAELNLCRLGEEEPGEILTDFFKSELTQFLTEDLDPLGRAIIEVCLRDGGIEEYEALTPMYA